MFEVGDIVFDIRHGFGRIEEIKPRSKTYPIVVSFLAGTVVHKERYLADGKYCPDDAGRMLLTKKEALDLFGAKPSAQHLKKTKKWLWVLYGENDYFVSAGHYSEAVAKVLPIYRVVAKIEETEIEVEE